MSPFRLVLASGSPARRWGAGSSRGEGLQRLSTRDRFLAWIVTAGLIFWGIGLIIEPVILLVISALLAYLCYPVVQLFQRIMPRALAISISLLLVLGVLCFLLYTVLVATVQQFVALIRFSLNPLTAY